MWLKRNRIHILIKMPNYNTSIEFSNNLKLTEVNIM